MRKMVLNQSQFRPKLHYANIQKRERRIRYYITALSKDNEVIIVILKHIRSILPYVRSLQMGTQKATPLYPKFDEGN